MRRGLVASAVLLLASSDASATPAPSWVFFDDKDGASESRLVERAAALAPRALARRQRARKDAGVDARDLDVLPRYLAGVSATGARVRVASRWLNAVSVVAEPERLAAIAHLPYVRAITPVARRLLRPPGPGKGTAPPRSVEPYGIAFDQLAMLGVPAMHDCGLTGAGVVVALLDSGFTLDHQAFAHLDVLAQHDFIQDDGTVSDEAGDPPGQHNHGTSVLSLVAGRDAGTFMGVAPEVTVILAKTEDIADEQPIEEDWFVAGLEWAESLGADVATASLGYVDWYTPEDLDGQTAVTTIAANIAMENGLVMIASAGNWGPDATTIGAPADADRLIAVGAVDLAGLVTDFSSRGPTFDGRIKPDVAALGRDDWVVAPGTLDGYAQGNGTSYAAPLVAGVAALLKQAYPTLTAADMHALLTGTATQASMPDNAMGYGIVRGYDAAGLYCTCYDRDDDGWFDAACGGQDCDDFTATANPDGTEQCNGRDDDCDGTLAPGEDDADGDGALACDDDCDDANPAVHAGATEICGDDIDNDCNGAERECSQSPSAAPVLPADAACTCRMHATRRAPPAWWLLSVGCALVPWLRARSRRGRSLRTAIAAGAWCRRDG
jgi:subtilase family protein/putative metal-binding protein